MPAFERPSLTPTDRDVLSSQAVGALRQAYDMGDWLAWQRTPKGSSNVSFFVTASSGRYVLRRSHSRKSIDAIRFEIKLIDYLREKGYPAPALVMTRQQEGYVEHDGILYLMTRFIPGHPYDPENPNHLFASGHGLGLYHRLVKDLPGPYYRRPVPALTTLEPTGIKGLTAIDRLAKLYLSTEEQKRLMDGFSYVQNQCINVCQSMVEISPRLSNRIIQGSFGRSALIFHGDTLSGVVDYDRATYELLGMDLAYAIKAFCRIHDEDSKDYRIGFDYARCRDFLLAYREAESLSAEEIQALPLIFRGQRLVKVQNKCDNLLRKDAVVPQEAKDVRKLAIMVEREARRLCWLEGHREALLATLMNECT
jgi:homoserine kinase type II